MAAGPSANRRQFVRRRSGCSAAIAKPVGNGRNLANMGYGSAASVMGGDRSDSRRCRGNPGQKSPCAAAPCVWHGFAGCTHPAAKYRRWIRRCERLCQQCARHGVGVGGTGRVEGRAWRRGQPGRNLARECPATQWAMGAGTFWRCPHAHGPGRPGAPPLPADSGGCRCTRQGAGVAACRAWRVPSVGSVRSHCTGLAGRASGACHGHRHATCRGCAQGGAAGRWQLGWLALCHGPGVARFACRQPAGHRP